MEDDIMLRELTVRENLMHSAMVRLPRDWTRRQIRHWVDGAFHSIKSLTTRYH
jgi:hypothetical protein